MWLGEQITEFGIGNGISMILFASIISRFPTAIITTISNIIRGELNVFVAILMFLGALAIVILIVFVNERRAPHPRPVRQARCGPEAVRRSGIQDPHEGEYVRRYAHHLRPDHRHHPRHHRCLRPQHGQRLGHEGIRHQLRALRVVYLLLIIGFSYFYATIQFNPVEVANNLKAQGGFIPGFRAGRPTADFLTRVLNRITMFGAIYLGIIALLPIITGNLIGLNALSIGGTSVLIVVSVALETQKALEAQMVMRTYKGFLN